MATLTIRNLADHVHRALRMRAAWHGNSMEAEVREILASTCLAEPPDMNLESIQEEVAGLFRDGPPDKVVDSFLADRRQDYGNDE